MTITNTKAAIIGISIFAVLAIIAFSVWFEVEPLYSNKSQTPTQTNLPTVSDDNGPFELVATYQGNSNWTYKVTAQLPNPCVKATVETIIAESYPEKVTVQVKTSNTGEICAQVIQNFNFESTFSASEKASIRLSVSN